MAGQIALLTVLAVSAGLLLRSSRNVSEEHWGYDAHKIFACKTAMKDTDFPTPQMRLATHMRLLDEIERLPGITGAAIMTTPIGFSSKPNVWYATSVDGLADGRSQGSAVYSAVTPSFFTVFGVTFLEGETFPRVEKVAPATPAPAPGATALPAKAAPLHAIITHHLAERLWPGQPAQGREFFARGQDSKRPPDRLTVSGVVRDFQAAGPKAEVNDAIYMSLGGGMWTASFLYASGAATLPTDEQVRGAARRVDPRIAIYFSNSMQHVIDTELGNMRLTTMLTSVYALAAVLLCAVGVYSITVSQILQRNREFGIRMALGIEPERLWVRFARGHLLTAAGGVVIGLAAATGVVHVLQSLLFGVNARDPATFTCGALVILLVSAVACIPSRFRLQRINPADCLRSL
ncbi:MAG: transporter permease [Verrucomicrobia bacterium]|nr:transporter permease [Verrucomicrobiota bacterium]